MQTASVLHADERLVALNKPPGVSLITRQAEPQAAVARLLAALSPEERVHHRLDAARLHLAHRLDIGTSGVVLLARDAETLRELIRLLAERRVVKTYLALAWGRARPRRGRWEWPLGPDRRDRRRMRTDPDGKAAVTDYEVIAVAPHVSLIELYPQTGRTHQLRVHLAYAGHPIVGDDLYGGPRHRGVRDSVLRRLLQPGHPLLHAWRLVLPTSAWLPAMTLEAPLPETFVAALARLGMPRAGARAQCDGG